MDFDFGPDSELYSLFHRIPRDETELSEFQKTFSEYDGRGIVIAILDTGIDPSAPGMQVTSEGSPKIIDIVDLTGSGDVDTSTKRRAQDSVLVGLTGRKLMSEKRKKEWTPLHLLATADVARLVENFENKNGVDQTKYTLKTRLDKQDLDSAESLLKSVDEMEDYGPVADCIVFHNGTSWVACLDTTFKGQLSECRLMSSYREKQEFDILTKQDLMAYSFNIYNNGDLLEICCSFADHGTHVAGIAAACHPDEPHRNGVAPGAQLISLQIGDHRLKGIETGTALLRAINYCIEHKVNIINYSFAESTHWEDDGKILDAIRDAAFNHDVIYVAAAGNEGPALTTVGCPGGSVDACVGITAYVSSAMRTKLYSLRDRLSPMVYSWSSRGPCSDGFCGVSVCAPGAAITCVPRWSRSSYQLFNGTSMSSPNAAGSIACILSGLSNRAAISPTMVKLAIENTAKPLEDIDDGCKLASGRGLLRVTEAFDYLKRFASKLERHVHYTVKVGDSGRGIYFRELAEVEQVHLITVNVKPVFSEKTDATAMASFNKVFMMRCLGADWINAPASIDVAYSGKSFKIRIDPRNLQAGHVHHTELLAFDLSIYDAGPMFSIPITVAVPLQCMESTLPTVNFQRILLSPTLCRRRFVHVPKDCNWAVLSFRVEKCDPLAQMVFHSVQKVPHQSFHLNEDHKQFSLSPGIEYTHEFPVVQDRTVEICLAKYWASSGEVVLENCTISFHGIVPIPSVISWEKCSPVYKLMVKCGPRSERFQPIMNLKSITVPLKPVKHELRPMGPRDLFYDGKQIYQLLITYKFEIDKSCIVTPNVPLLSEHLYESDYCGYIWSIYDINNAYMFSGGSYPDRFSTKLEEGEYSMILQIRHYCKDALEQAKGTLATVNCKLATPIAVDSYENWPSSFKNAEKFTSCLLQRGEMKAIYFAFPTIENLPIHASAGSFLCGHLVMSRCELTKTALPVMFDVKLYVQMDMPKKKKKSFTLVPDVDRKISSFSVEELIHRYKVWLMARRGLTTSNMLYSELIEQESSDAVYCTLTRLIYLMKYQMANCQQEIYNLSIKLLNLIDRNQLIIFFGGNRDFDPDWVKRKNKMEYLKNVMLVALFAKGTVILSTIRKNFDQKLSDVSVACGALEFPKVLHDASGSYVGESTLSTDDSSTSNGSSEDNEVSSVEAQTQEAAAVSEKKKSENAEEQKPENWYASFKICDVEAILLEMLQLADMEHPLVRIHQICTMMKMTLQKHSDEIGFQFLFQLIPFCCNYAIYTGRYFWAVALLDKLLKEDPKSKELKALKISLVQKIGWLHVADNLINGILVKHPPSQRLL
ncbi:Tripeptidyl-peptidase 2 [Trichinella pseudospiralis]|uniref:Tripeptidyl-peptidase 2 n=1 Tax=Trichinella pseudospiralis TaxID=6337 RepID=A0A0V1JU95_TRIPS|nr:Tripeptidyl-peptidase 2 [Trichinella pseudospiralis]